MDAVEPIWVGQVELGQALGAIDVRGNPDGPSYERAMLLVRLHRQPLGFLETSLQGGRLGAEALASRVWEALGDRISAHLLEDRLRPVQGLPADGLAAPPTPRCRGDIPTEDAAPSVTIAVATRDRPQQLLACLDGLLALPYPRFEVVVVDNAPSTAATAVVLRERHGGDRRVRYVLEPRRGLSYARNRGLAEARGSLVAFTDDDVRVDRWWLHGLVRGFSRAPGVVCVTGLVCPARLATPAQVLFQRSVSWGSDSGCRPRLFDLQEHRLPTPLYPYRVGAYGTGANAAFDAAFLRSIGGFDRALGTGTPAAGGEDLDAFLRVVRSGQRLAFEPSAVLWHDYDGEAAALRRQMFHYGTGLAAVLTKCLLGPDTRREVLARVPEGLRYLLDPSSAKNAQKVSGFALSLRALELLGMAWGPLAYRRSLRRARAWAP